MLSVVIWKWNGNNGWKKYTSENVNIMKERLRTNLRVPHQVFCLTDDFEGLDRDIIPVDIDLVSGPAPFKAHPSKMLRSCYRRLRLFDPAMERIFGKRLLQLDLDMVVTGNITHIAERTEPFVIWKSHSNGQNRNFAYNTSVILMDTGARADIWDKYSSNVEFIANAANKSYWTGTDQAVIGYLTPQEPPLFTKEDGIYAWRDDPEIVGKDPLPDHVRLVSFHGWSNPYDPEMLQKHEWLKRSLAC